MAEKCSSTECSVKLKELEERLRRLELERDTAIQEKESFVAENKDMEDKIRQLEKQIASLKNEVAEQQRHLQHDHQQKQNMTQEIKSLKDRVADLEGKVADLTKGSATLYVAQAASLFQQSVCCALLPETFTGDRSATIKELVSYLKGQKELPEDVNDDLGTARNRWEDIRRNLGWTKWNDDNWEFNGLPNDLKAIISLKKVRVHTAHPPIIELKEAMKCVSQVEVRESVRQHIRNFIGTMEDKMRRCGLSNEGIEELREISSNEDILQLDIDLQ